MLDILAGEGVAIIDPHGDLAEMVADCVPSSRTHQVCYLDVTDTDLPVGFNPLANVRAGSPGTRRLRYRFGVQAAVVGSMGTST